MHRQQLVYKVRASYLHSVHDAYVFRVQTNQIFSQLVGNYPLVLRVLTNQISHLQIGFFFRFTATTCIASASLGPYFSRGGVNKGERSGDSCNIPCALGMSIS